MSTVRDFIDRHFLHFNSREVVAAARAWEEHLAGGGKMMITLAGAMSTARVGGLLSRLIHGGKVHAVTCTGANLEEDIFALFAYDQYEDIENWRALTAADESALLDRGMNRVTDMCIPETVMRDIERPLTDAWRQAAETGEPLFPHEFLWKVLGTPGIEERFALPRDQSWVLACKETGTPIYTPGWEDSTTGNMFASAVFQGRVASHGAVRSGTEQMEALMRWYLANCGKDEGKPSVGFFQIGGGIAGDFPICAVPALIQDCELEDTPFWGYFCQISDATTSYGGYSGAVPNEKITWGKLEESTPKFMIQSDATIVAPLIFAWLLGD